MNLTIQHYARKLWGILGCLWALILAPRALTGAEIPQDESFRVLNHTSYAPGAHRAQIRAHKQPKISQRVS